MGQNGYCDQVGLYRSVVVGRQGVQLDGTNCYMSTMFNSVNENDEGLFRTKSREKREKEKDHVVSLTSDGQSTSTWVSCESGRTIYERIIC